MPYFTLHQKRELNALVDHIKDAVYSQVAPLTVEAYVTPEPVRYTERKSGRHLILNQGDKWGNLFDCAWFHFTGRVPATVGGEQIVALIDVNGEACVYDDSGCPVLGLTNINSEFDLSLGKPGKRVVSITPNAGGAEYIDIWADAGCNDLFGRLQENGTLKQANIAIRHPNLYALSYDFEVLHELMQQLPENSARRQRIWTAMTRAALVLQHINDDEAAQARKMLAPELEKRGGDPSLTISAIGHAHIDLAWLWPIRETIRKGARTFSTALDNMERYPDYVFGASQAQLYDWMKQHYPALYQKVRRRIAEGRWEVQGAMWVEADTNISGGEALVRQILYGKRFFRNEFGSDVNNLWLPDVFGYSGALPQILAKSGVRYFMTQKLSWSQVNQIPHHSFWWHGIDGSRVLAHLAPEGTYNSSAAPRALAAAENNYLDKRVSTHCLLVFGIGDGGGGPGEEHLERLQREKNLQGLSPVIQEPASQFFERLEQESGSFHKWNGELYLERHQGTYTTQGRNKRYNRKMEIALRELELAAAKAWWLSGRSYPADELQNIWREVLLYQFHDILPGSSITRVYDESLARYAALMEHTLALTREADSQRLPTISNDDSPTAYAITNSLSWARTDWVKLAGSWHKVTVPSLGETLVYASAPDEAYVSPTATELLLENDRIRITFNADGSISSIFDKQNNRDVVDTTQPSNQMALYRDLGDAWDFQMHYDEQQPERFDLQEVKCAVDGPQASVTHTYAHGITTLVQHIRLAAGSRRIDFDTHVDWHETHMMLRTSFPVAVQSTEVTCDIQFGNIKRSTHRNTSWEMAQYEICAHKWIDISERSYGVALMNDSKYGHKAIDNVLDLNLLRSPTYPDPFADRGEHDFTYSLLPHLGDYYAGEVIQRAYELNIPLRVAAVDTAVTSRLLLDSLLTINAANIIVEAVKRAEDTESMVIRMYESCGASTQATMHFGVQIGEVTLIDMMEEKLQALAVTDNQVSLHFSPYEIQTISIKRP